jgi:hypothetical protein
LVVVVVVILAQMAAAVVRAVVAVITAARAVWLRNRDRHQVVLGSMVVRKLALRVFLVLVVVVVLVVVGVTETTPRAAMVGLGDRRLLPAAQFSTLAVAVAGRKHLEHL